MREKLFALAGAVALAMFAASTSVAARDVVQFDSGLSAGTVVVVTHQRRLYYVLGSGQAILGALTLAGPRSRIDETFIANARVLLLRVACRASKSLGGDASPIEAALAMTLAGKRAMARPAKMGART